MPANMTALSKPSHQRSVAAVHCRARRNVGEVVADIHQLAVDVASPLGRHLPGQYRQHGLVEDRETLVHLPSVDGHHALGDQTKGCQGRRAESVADLLGLPGSDQRRLQVPGLQRLGRVEPAAASRSARSGMPTKVSPSGPVDAEPKVFE